jgi:hypothetical protein
MSLQLLMTLFRSDCRGCKQTLLMLCCTVVPRGRRIKRSVIFATRGHQQFASRAWLVTWPAACILMSILIANTSETSVNFCQTTWCNIPEDIHLHTRQHETVKSYQIFLLFFFILNVFRKVEAKKPCTSGNYFRRCISEWSLIIPIQ